MKDLLVIIITAVCTLPLSVRAADADGKLSFFASKQVPIPIAVSAFPDELYQAPRSWVERAHPKLGYYNKLDKGGHFAAWEQPELFSSEQLSNFCVSWSDGYPQQHRFKSN
jgi:hypothetical protein